MARTGGVEPPSSFQLPLSRFVAEGDTFAFGAATELRSPVTTLRGSGPGPLDDRRVFGWHRRTRTCRVTVNSRAPTPGGPDAKTWWTMAGYAPPSLGCKPSALLLS